MTVVIAGDRSNVGKTTITLAMLAWLSQQKLGVQSFKVGPDYIDPMFHSAITDRPCRNLDPILTSENYVKSCWARHSTGVDAVVVEGVMGLFDGVSLPNFSEPHFASTAHIAKLLDAPVVLVLNCAGVSASIAAIVKGFRDFDPKLNLAGVILNRVASQRHLTLLQKALEPLSIPLLGILYRHSDISLPQRHLGLVPSEEIDQLQSLIDRLAALAAESFNWERLLPLLLPPSPHLPISPSPHPPISLNKTIKIGVARDRAFNFYYQDNLDLLEALGAKIIPFSPLENRTLPPVDGIYLGGGFPEMFAPQLSDNKPLLQQLRGAIAHGIPVYAECGGLMYLSESITDFDGHCWPQLGILPTAAVMSSKLTLGYRRAVGTSYNRLIGNQTIWGHEFHRSCLTQTSDQPLWQLQTLYSPKFMAEGWQQKQIYASYLHLHWGENQTMVKNWLNSCQYRADRLE